MIWKGVWSGHGVCPKRSVKIPDMIWAPVDVTLSYFPYDFRTGGYGVWDRMLLLWFEPGRLCGDPTGNPTWNWNEPMEAALSLSWKSQAIYSRGWYQTMATLRGHYP